MTTTVQHGKFSGRVLAGPVTRPERALAPDLARGAMLLFIALANAANFAFAGQPGLDPTPHGVQRVVNFLMATFVDARAYPVFAVMFGYGLVQIAHRQRAAGADERRVLLRRNAFLVVFGLFHATLLYFGDFLGAYGIVGIIATLVLLRRGDRFHRVAPWLWGIQLVYIGFLAVTAITGMKSGDATVANVTNPSLAAGSYAQSLVDRLAEWPVHTSTVVPFIFIVWLGIWAARQRILENPAAHTVLLRRVAVVCLGITVLGALPYAMVAAGVLYVTPDTVDSLSMLQQASGCYGGAGYVALFGLLAVRLADGRRRPIVDAVAALGRRSLSGYLFQSVAWITLFSTWALDLGGSTWVAAGAAVAVWTVSVAAARSMELACYRGPAETLLRKLTYRA
ncbi:DUF418 domain-containing protein [Virgisporangium aurantiacum]|uniref:DUF418 domain-containing protein n=1 Tax=Virgisporangium aurantiacum TaxID=175570 RepID=A0A8J3Z7T1_9ACTN|nr:DUF418 domain-containing protein [Virgisporangium aurantiacum]GIJ59044.1 hypothetical protein Vau01_065600 [Virgisporangium aurantiacum]